MRLNKERKNMSGNFSQQALIHEIKTLIFSNK